jgi:hypothetical protein
MDGQHFDTLTRMLCGAGTRRGLFAQLAILPGLRSLLALLDPDDSAAKGRRTRPVGSENHKRGGRRRKHKKHQKKHTRCTAESLAKSCAGRCGQVRNKCKKRVDCGSCECAPPCDACRVCNDLTGVCETDPAQQGVACGEPGQICQTSGDCACDATSCPECSTCQGDGTCSGPCSGATPVCFDGACVCGDVCESGCPSTTVQGAIDAANSGDTIRLCAGSYLGSNAVADIDKDLTIVGAGDGADPATETILDADGTGQVLRIRSTRTVTVQGLRITGGVGSAGGVRNEGDLTMSGCTVHRNTGAAGGPGGILSLGPLSMTDCTVSENTTASNNTGGIRMAGGGILLRLTRCTIRENTGGVGGLYVQGTGTLTETTITANTGLVATLAGGLYIAFGTTTLIDSTISGNTPRNCGTAGSGTIVGPGCAP